jgi:hypothetical protein
LRLGLSSDARYAGWMAGCDRGSAAYLISRKMGGRVFVGLKPYAPSVVIPSRRSRTSVLCGGRVRFERGSAAYFISRTIGGSGSPGLRLGLLIDARYAGWMVGFDCGSAACLISGRIGERFATWQKPSPDTRRGTKRQGAGERGTRGAEKQGTGIRDQGTERQGAREQGSKGAEGAPKEKNGTNGQADRAGRPVTQTTSGLENCSP